MNLYNISINDINGKPIDLKKYLGKKMMIVNVASECGFTKQYTQLEELYSAFKDKLVILACPCNDFGGQEPGSDAEIINFCQKNYGVSFPITQKIEISNNPHPLYQFLTNKDKNGIGDFQVEWNFHKFLISESGKLQKNISSATDPMDEMILSWLENDQH